MTSWRRLRKLAFRALPKVARWSVLMAYFAVVFGVPVPTRSSKDLSQPFPCQDRPCGCMSADQCWKHCCCFTDEQKIAWAIDRGVAIPDYVLAKASSAPRLVCQVVDKQGDPSASSCCQSIATPSTACGKPSEQCSCGSCDQQDVKVAPTCCQQAPVVASEDAEDSVELVLGALTAKCNGSASEWLAMLAGFVPPSKVVLSFERGAIDWLRPVDVQSIHLTFPPPLPPPRAGSLG